MNRQTTILASIAIASAVISASALTTSFHGYNFEVKVIGKSGRTMAESWQNSRSTLFVKDGSEYSVVIKNPLPVRVGVALTVDGLNSIDGKRTTADNASKWMIDSYSSITIKGWQTGSDRLRRFVFTRQSDTYAQWKEKRDDADYTANLGVIGVAYFWNSGELRDALNPPQPFAYNEREDRAADLAPAASQPAYPAAGAGMSADACKSRKAQTESAPAAKKAEERAGTGMGRAENNSVEQVEFTYDTGMYANSDVMKIYYEFMKKAPQPQPFMDDRQNSGYAPEMHSYND
jgi:hypothetical protein